jgi:hypothetical protein
MIGTFHAFPRFSNPDRKDFPVEPDTLIKTDSNHTVELDNIKPPPHYNAVKGPQIITSDTARQGPLGSPVLAVLIGGMVAVCIAFALVYFFSYR